MKTFMALSGGLDSAVLLAKCLTDGDEVVPVQFQYGSTHNQYELEAAQKLCNYYGIQLFVKNLTEVLSWGGGTSALLHNGDVPEGHYNEETMRKTVVPGRNLAIISALASLAETHGGGRIALGVHAGDHNIYPDCRPAFIQAASEVVMASSNGVVDVYAPFIYINKTQIVKVGLKYNVPFENTRTCYKNQPIACGKCGSCQERLEAFCNADFVDPISYVSRKLIAKSS